MLGFTLMELLSSTAIIGALASVAVPFIMEYVVQSRVTDGVALLDELKQRIELGFDETGALAEEIPASPTPSGQIYGGPYYTYETLFGVTHEMWDRFEYQPKGPHRVIALRAYRKPEWENSDIGIYLQIQLKADNTLDFRCTVSDQLTRVSYVPSSCRDGDLNDWTSW